MPYTELKARFYDTTLEQYQNAISWRRDDMRGATYETRECKNEAEYEAEREAAYEAAEYLEDILKNEFNPLEICALAINEGLDCPFNLSERGQSKFEGLSDLMPKLIAANMAERMQEIYGGL